MLTTQNATEKWGMIAGPELAGAGVGDLEKSNFLEFGWQKPD